MVNQVHTGVDLIVANHARVLCRVVLDHQSRNLLNLPRVDFDFGRVMQVALMTSEAELAAQDYFGIRVVMFVPSGRRYSDVRLRDLGNRYRFEGADWVTMVGRNRIGEGSLLTLWVEQGRSRQIKLEDQTPCVLEEKEERIGPGTLLGTSHIYVIGTGTQDKTAAKRVRNHGVDVTLQLEELELMDNVLPAKCLVLLFPNITCYFAFHMYEEAREEEKLRSQREDFSDMVAR